MVMMMWFCLKRIARYKPYGIPNEFSQVIHVDRRIRAEKEHERSQPQKVVCRGKHGQLDPDVATTGFTTSHRSLPSRFF
jgi:hypothetical protein